MSYFFFNVVSDEPVSVLATKQHIRRRRQQYSELDIIAFVVIISGWFPRQQSSIDCFAKYKAREKQDVQTLLSVLHLLLVAAGFA